MQGCPANAEAALVVVVVVVHRADGVGALRPGPEGLVVGTPDAGADGDAQPRDAHRAQAVDVDVAAKVARVGVRGDHLQELVVALADHAAVVGGGKVDDAALVQLVEVGDGLAVRN